MVGRLHELGDRVQTLLSIPDLCVAFKIISLNFLFLFVKWVLMTFSSSGWDRCWHSYMLFNVLDRRFEEMLYLQEQVEASQ